MDDFLGKPLAVGDVVARISRGGGRRGFRKGVVVNFTKKKVGVGDEVGGYTLQRISRGFNQTGG